MVRANGFQKWAIFSVVSSTILDRVSVGMCYSVRGLSSYWFCYTWLMGTCFSCTTHRRSRQLTCTCIVRTCSLNSIQSVHVFICSISDPPLCSCRNGPLFLFALSMFSYLNSSVGSSQNQLAISLTCTFEKVDVSII